MKRIIIVLLVLAFSASSAFALSAQQESDIALTDKLVQSEADNRDLNTKLTHAKDGQKFYWAVIGAFILYDMSRNRGGDSKPDKPSCR